MTPTTDGYGTVRLRDLDPAGWAFIGAGALAFVFGVAEALAVVLADGAPALVVLLLAFGAACLWFANETARPEVDAHCGECNEPVTVNTGQESWDAAVTVHYSQPPERLGRGLASVVTGRDYQVRTYCSATCAHADLGPIGAQDEPEPPTTTATVNPDPAGASNTHPDAEVS